MEYRITYIAYRDEIRTVKCDNFEDAEKIAQFIANLPLVQNVTLTDGAYYWPFEKEVVAT